MTRAHQVAIHLAVVAMLLRAMLPMGWMPDGTGATAFAICTVDGGGHHAQQQSPGKPDPADGQHGHDECPFAAAHHVAAPVAAGRLAAPSYAGHAADITHPVADFGLVTEYGLHSPRAPPHLA